MLEAIRITSDRKETQYQARQEDYLSSPVVDRHATVLTLVPNVVTGMPFKKSLQEVLVKRSASHASMHDNGRKTLENKFGRYYFEWRWMRSLLRQVQRSPQKMLLFRSCSHCLTVFVMSLIILITIRMYRPVLIKKRSTIHLQTVLTLTHRLQTMSVDFVTW